MKVNFQSTFTSSLEGDDITDNFRRQVIGAHFSFVSPRKPKNPLLVHYSDEMLTALGLSKEEASSEDFLNLVSGTTLPSEVKPFAMCYGGHQFGHWSGQLGDGRAINLGNIVHDGHSWELQLKGSGETPYSRSADGLAVLRSSIREHLCSEAMFHLGVPTTRSLSLCLSGDDVLRDVLYNGNPAYEKGAIVCRVSPSFLRFGNFEILSSRKDVINLRKLADFTIKNHFPSISLTSDDRYIQFYQRVVNRTLKMIVDWQRVGFVHGVMNTDNMSILGLTIDYGPYGWLEGFDTQWTPNTTDKQNKRYRFGNQPAIALWNLYQLANALFPLINDAKPLEESLDNYKSDFIKARLVMMKSKLGLVGENPKDEQLVNDLEALLELVETDMTLFFRELGKLNSSDTPKAALNALKYCFYNYDAMPETAQEKWISWLKLYLERIDNQQLSDAMRRVKMNAVNPKYVLRNYMAQLAIDQADKMDFALIDELYKMLKKPYDEQPEFEKWYAKRPEWARHKVGCSMLSCSS